MRNAGSHYYSVSRRCDASWILFLPVHIYSSSTMCGVEYKNCLCTYTLRIFFTAIGKNPIGIMKKRNKLNITLIILNPSISWNVKFKFQGKLMKIYSTLFTLFLLRLHLAYLFLPPVIHFCLHITFTRSKKILLRWSKEHRLHFLMRYRILSFFIFSCL